MKVSAGKTEVDLKTFIAKTPSTNLFEMNSIYTFIDLFIHNKCIDV